jgi:hypothetical protein
MSRIKQQSMIEESIEMMNTNINNPELPAIKQIVRSIAKGMTNPAIGMFSEVEVSAYVSSWVDKGYKIANVTFLESTPDGAITILYVLVRSDVLA